MAASDSGASLAAPRSGNPAVARILPFAVYIGFLILGQQLAAAYPQWDLRWLYALQIGAVLLTLALFSRAYVELDGAADVSARDWLLALAAGAAVFVVWVGLDQPWARSGDGGGFDASRADGSLDWTLVGVRLFGAAAVVPLMEELFWRSFILRWIGQRDFLRLAPAAAGLRALLLSSLVFGVEHDLWLAGILAGLVYGGLYMRSASLWPPIAAHAATNLLLGVWVVATGSWRLW
jgi:CAAX prenyl protease-like protein